MTIALFGSTGMVGRRVLAEAQTRGHEVTPLHSGNSDIFSPARVASSVAGSGIVISAYGPGPQNAGKLVEATRSLLEGVTQSGVARLLTVGGAGALEIAPGVRLIDAPQFPQEWKGIAQAHIDALALIEQSPLEWTVAAPAALIEPGTRTGRYRVSPNQLLTGADGQSRISAEDFSVAILDEVENPQHRRARFGVAY